MHLKGKITGPFQDICVREAVGMGALVLAVMVFAIGVVFTKHTSRVMHAKSQAINTERDTFNNEWSQLQLEQATLTSGLRVEKIATEQLQMTTPTKVEIIKP